ASAFIVVSSGLIRSPGRSVRALSVNLVRRRPMHCDRYHRRSGCRFRKEIALASAPNTCYNWRCEALTALAVRLRAGTCGGHGKVGGCDEKGPSRGGARACAWETFPEKPSAGESADASS